MRFANVRVLVAVGQWLFENQISKTKKTRWQDYANGSSRKGCLTMPKDITAKLKACEASLKRWQSRLKRAANKVADLDKQRRRLQAQMGPVGLADLIGTTPARTEPKLVQAVETDHISDLDLPAFLDRRNPDGIRKAARELQEKADAQLVDKLKAQRADQVEADKHKMPLTGRAAMDYLKVTPKKKKTKSASTTI